MMFKVLCLAALLAAASAQKCGPGTALVGEYCVAQMKCGRGTALVNGACEVVVEDRARRATVEDPKIETLAKNLIFTTDADASVGVKQKGSDVVQKIETSASAVNAVMSALKLGYAMNREIDQIKDMNLLKENLTKMINTVKEDSSKAATALETSLGAKSTASKKAVDDALAAGQAKSEKAIEAALAAVKKASDASAETLKTFKASTESTIAGLAEAVPAASCANKKKDGDETDVDCGGSCGKSCPKGKQCKYTSDCKASLCMGGRCNTCKSKSGPVELSPGVTAACKSGRFQPSTGMEFIRFDTCGRTGEQGPTPDDCMMQYSLVPSYYTIHQPFVTYEHGFQVFTAPIDGNYKWYVVGAQGGTDVTCCHGGNSYQRYGKGGQGGRVIALQSNVKAGTKFYIRAGQMGTDGYETKSGMRDPANRGSFACKYSPSGHRNWDNGKQWYEPGATHKGFGSCGGFGGSIGGPAIANNNPGGASGGGSSDVRMCKNGEGCPKPPGMAERFIVAGAGGGGASEGNDAHGCNHNCRWGGNGGGTTADNGYNNGNVGYGGRQDRGGRSQNENSKDYGQSWGTKEFGGTGGRNDGGGGGGGYWGGGGARYNAGGGGGSSFIKGTSASGGLSVSANDKGWRKGDGYVWLSLTSTN